MNDGVEVARITITRVIGDDDEYGDVVNYEATDSDGSELALIEVLGMLRMAEDTAIRHAMGED